MTATRGGKPTDTDLVACDICFKEIPLSESISPEATQYVAHFCGLECYEKWKSRLATPEALARAAKKSEPPVDVPEPEIQEGRGRGAAKDERMKKLVTKHPRRG